MNMKKLFLLNLPYLLFVYPFDKLAQAFRLAPGADLSGKLLSIGDGFTAALSSPWLSFHPTDLLIGIAGAVIRLAVLPLFYLFSSLSGFSVSATLSIMSTTTALSCAAFCDVMTGRPVSFSISCRT